ncbi:NAD(P)-dependent dehydrogenase, short-chain alcohol dehydrogenase family [Salinibacillus kushneri]|uniref:NAD(P)-dependent dehydrogenase, short-chain alcohol dehydrogenase family n=1 Tax=Salinibacillus kushneri TaxID=237682 RepID=A0A1I0ABN3_9BACI|nr:SDR family oxidoreductase [Salinibacillus kushneri]SES90663.1 NAD(P)-dependent dehydrogenase, short-chain alcohol dehydrogenase family [Salinibacillus kushneri]
MDLGLANKVALVTGGSKGIGKAIAKALADENVKVAIAARSQEELEQTKHEIEQNGSTALSIVMDITNDDDVKQGITSVINHFGQLDILVNNAGITPGFFDFEDIEIDDWKKIFDINVFGMVRTTKTALPYLKESDAGRIINISSESGVQPDGFMPDYNATKAAIINMTKSWSKAFAKDGILVNTVSPAFILTPLLDQAMKQDADKQGISKEEAIQQFLKENRSHIEVKRPGNPEEVASSVVFLASNQASFINGTNLRVDGGSVASQ